MQRMSFLRASAYAMIGFTTPVPAFAQVSVPTQHNDNARTGANLRETILNSSNINKNRFGKLAFRLVDGNVYAQPLVIAQAKVANRSNATNIVLVATEHNSVYAFDGQDVDPNSQTAELWHTGPEVFGPSIDSDDILEPSCDLVPAGRAMASELRARVEPGWD